MNSVNTTGCGELWLKERRQYVGASEVSAIMGRNRYSGGVDVWMAKTGRVEGDFNNYRIRKGNSMEGFILDEALKAGAGLPGWTSRTVAGLQKQHTHRDFDRLKCHPDCEVVLHDGSNVIIEAKSTSIRAKKSLQDWKENEYPNEGTTAMMWWVQVQAQLAIMDLNLGYLAADCDGELFVIEVKRNSSFEMEMLKAVREFWEYVDTDVCPPVQTAPDSASIDKLYPSSSTSGGDTEGVMLRDPLLGSIREIENHKASIRELKDEIKLLEGMVKAELAWSDVGLINGEVRCTWKEQSTTRLDSSRLKEEMPEVFDKYKKTTTSRVFRVKASKEEA